MKPQPGPVGADVDRYGNENERGTGHIEYFRCFVGFLASQVVLVLVADIPIHPRVGEHGGPGNTDSELCQVRPIQVKIPEVRFYGCDAPGNRSLIPPDTSMTA